MLAPHIILCFISTKPHYTMLAPHTILCFISTKPHYTMLAPHTILCFISTKPHYTMLAPHTILCFISTKPHYTMLVPHTILCFISTKPHYTKLPPECQGTLVDFTCLLKNAIFPIHINSNQPNCTGALATGQAMLQWKKYQARHWPQVKLCCSGKNTRHVIGHRSSYAAVERIPGTSLATGQAMLQWKEYQHVRHRNGALG